MKSLIKWLNANKILLNVKTTEQVIFKHKNKKLGCPLKVGSIGKDSILLNW